MASIGVLGSGAVGITLARGFAALGHHVSIGTRDGHPVAGWDGGTGNFHDVASGAQTVVLSVRGDAAEAVVRSIAASLAGKTVIDTTNPIDHSRAPVNGVLPFFTGPNDSLLEHLQAIAPQARWVKAFNSVGNAHMVQPAFAERPTMFICGNHPSAKDEVVAYLNAFGWDAEDMGQAEAARAIEPLCILWCIPGFLHNDWKHAFRMVR